MNKVYACSDLHGRLDIWNNIKEELDESDTLYFLGDACDRGSGGWQIIKELIDMPNVIYILGNHELMFYESYLGPYKIENKKMHLYNNGDSTIEAYEQDSKENQKKYMKVLKSLPIEASYQNKEGKFIHLSHTGSYLNDTEEELKSITFISEDKKFKFVWDKAENFNENDNKYDIIVYGHTPSSILKNNLDKFDKIYILANNKSVIDKYVPDEILWTHNFSKVDIDCGAFWTGYAILLDLDTLEYKKIYGNN